VGGSGGRAGSARPEKHLPVYTGEPDEGAVTHCTARLALEPRASAEALRVADAAPPLLVAGVRKLLRLVRPLSFAQ
jgi:hypothetical protein